MSRFEQRKQEAMRDPEFREAYDAADLEIRFSMATALVYREAPPTGLVGTVRLGYDYFNEALYYTNPQPHYEVSGAVRMPA
jgi:hypothetical protein